jgi:hypothetical protein
LRKTEEKISSKGYKFFSVIFCVILAAILVGTVNFTNINGVTTQYYVYKSANASLGSTTVTVS